jgi:siroheme synthase
MAMNRLPEVQDQLRRAGLPDDTPVEIIAAIETLAEARLQTTLGRLSGDGGLGHPAIIFVRIAKVAAPATLPVQA